MCRRKPSRLSRGWKWLIGAALSAATAVIVAAATGAFSAASKWAASQIAPKDPLKVAVARLGFSSYVIPRPLDQLPPPRPTKEEVCAADEIDSWASSLGDAVDAYMSEVMFSVTGRDATPVVLTGLSVTVVARQPPLIGTHMFSPYGGGTGLRSFYIELDSTPPLVVARVGSVGPDGISFPYKVSLVEPEVFVISAIVQSGDCSWVAELSWMHGDKCGCTVISDKGRPFRTTSTQNAPSYEYLGSSESPWYQPADFFPGGEDE